MIVLSMVLVVVGFVLLMLGVLGVGASPLDFVYYSIGACLLAAVFLIIGVIRGRPSKKPITASGGEGKEASWAGASAWNDATPGEQGDRGASTAVLDRDQAAVEEQPRVQVVAAQDVAAQDVAEEETSPTEAPAADEGWAPDEAEPQEATSPSGAPPAAGTSDEAEVVVPKASAAGRAGDGGAQGATADEAAEGGTPTGAEPAGRATAKKATARKATAKKTTAGKATARKGTAKKAGAAPGGGEAQKFEDALWDVSGVGATKRRHLVDHFGTYERLRSATVKELAEVEGISQTLATRIRTSLDARGD